MDEIISAQWTDDTRTIIAVTIKGAMVAAADKTAELDEEGETVMFVPDDMDNRHRQELAAWEAEGNEIAPASEARRGRDELRR